MAEEGAFRQVWTYICDRTRRAFRKARTYIRHRSHGESRKVEEPHRKAIDQARARNQATKTTKEDHTEGVLRKNGHITQSATNSDSAAQIPSTQLLPNEHIKKHDQDIEKIGQYMEKHRRYTAAARGYLDKKLARFSELSDSELGSASDLNLSQSANSTRIGSANSPKNTDKSRSSATSTSAAASPLDVAQASGRPVSDLDFEAPAAPVMNHRFYALDYPTLTAERQDPATGR